MKLPLDWPRINQFPEWYTVDSETQYTVHDLTANSRVTYTGKQLHEGVAIRLQPGIEHRLVVTSYGFRVSSSDKNLTAKTPRTPRRLRKEK